MTPFGINRKNWRRKAGVRKCTDCDHDEFIGSRVVPEDCRSAIGADAEPSAAAPIADSNVFGCAPGYDQLLLTEPRLEAERAAGPLRACKAMAHRGADRLARAFDSELAVVTGRASLGLQARFRRMLPRLPRTGSSKGDSIETHHRYRSSAASPELWTDS